MPDDGGVALTNQALFNLVDDGGHLPGHRRESTVRSYSRSVPFVMERGSGVTLTDTRGQSFIDCLAGAGALPLGYAHPEVNAALTKALADGIPYQLLDLRSVARERFIETVFAFLPPGFAATARVQFCGPSGADAVEAAMKLAKKATGRDGILAFHGGYHGMTAGALAATGNLKAKSRRGGLMPDVHFLPYPYSLRCPFGLGGEAGARLGLRTIEHMLDDVESGIPKPAAILLEPIQGEGGVIPAPAFWLQEMRRITGERDILLIADEIQCGIARSGQHFAFETAAIEPDILIVSKAIGGGLPLSMLLFHERLDCWNPGEHSGTFRGNQLAMVAGAITLEIIMRDGLAGHAARMGERLMTHLASIASRHEWLAETRGRGLMIGIEVADPSRRNRYDEPGADPDRAMAVQRGMLERGVIIERGGRSSAVLRFLPPLIISEADIDRVADVLDQAASAAS